MSGEGKFSHFDEAGNARMVDVGSKEMTHRTAVAKGKVVMHPDTYHLIREGKAAKGDVIGVSRIAGIMAAKKVDSIIPLCHPLRLDSIVIDFEFEENGRTVGIEAKVSCTGKTGVEMEAMTAVSVAALTIYDMCKSVDRTITISDIRLLQKSGGKSGTFVREQ